MSLQEHPPKRQPSEERHAFNTTVNTFSRVIAVMLLAALPVVVGHLLDRWLGTSILIFAGFLIGMPLAVFGLVMVAKKANEELRDKS